MTNGSSDTAGSRIAPRSWSWVGYRFHPTDEELVGHFLMSKLLGYDDGDMSIPEIKVCNHEPWDLPGLLKKEPGDLAGYFFSPRDYKYLGSLRSNRTTKAGFWKPTGKPRNVIDTHTKTLIGTKRSLVFYVKDHPKPVRTKWIMHEYDITANSNSTLNRNFVLHKLKAKLDENINEVEQDHMRSPSETGSQSSSVMTVDSSCDQHEESHHMASNIEEHYLEDTITMSACDEGSQSTLIGSDFAKQHQNETTSDSACDESHPGFQLDCDLEISTPSEITAMSVHEKGRSSLDSEDQSPDKIEGASASEGVIWNSPAMTPEPENQSLHDWTPMPTPSIGYGPENNTAAATIFEEETSLDEELMAMLGPDDSINSVSALLSPMGTEGDLYWPSTGFCASIPGGQETY